MKYIEKIEKKNCNYVTFLFILVVNIVNLYNSNKKRRIGR